MQSAKGMRGAFIVRRPKGLDPMMDLYDEERLVIMADEWQDPDVCLKLEGAMAGNDVCSDIDWASVNGQIATGQYQKFDKKYPYPLIDRPWQVLPDAPYNDGLKRGKLHR